MGRRARWTAEQARRELQAFEASGLSLAAFARERGIDVKRLYRWRDRFRQERPADAPVRLVELVARTMPTAGSVHVRCPSGHVVTLDGVDLEAGLALVLKLTAAHGEATC